MSEIGRKIAGNTMIVAGATLISRILGFVRDLIVAFALGAGSAADAFFVAFRIPNLMRRLFGEGSLTMAFIPVFSRIREEEGEESAQAMARSALIWLVIILGAITLLAELLANPLVMVIAPGFTDDPVRFDLTVKLVRICFPYVILISGVALCMGILNSLNHFLAPALAPVMLNIALIGSALIGYYSGFSVAVSMGYGVLVGGAAQWALQQPFLRNRGFRWKGNWSFRDKGVRRMAVLMLPTVFGAAVYQINIVLGTLLASFLPEGSVSFLYYADRLVQFPLGVFGIAVSTAALPSLAKLAATNDHDGFASALRSSLGLTMFIALPAAAGLLALAEPVISLLFQRGAFTHTDVTATAQALIAYSAGLPFIAMSRPLVAAFYAREDMKTPVYIAVISLVINIGLGATLMLWMDHVGLALSVSISSAANSILLYWFNLKRTGDHCISLIVMIKIITLSGLIFIGAFFTNHLQYLWIALVPFWIAGYILAARALRLEEAELFTGMIRRRLRR